MVDVILVDDDDREVGELEKIAAHEQGRLHRAVSVMVRRSSGAFIVQYRAGGVYHSAGLLSNTACTHPQPGESAEEAGHRALRSELGFVCDLDYAGSFLYRAQVQGPDGPLIEHELDHVFTGVYDGTVHPNPDKVARIQVLAPEIVAERMRLYPDDFTPWFAQVYAMVQNLK